MSNRSAPYRHADGSNCWTKNCRFRQPPSVDTAASIVDKVLGAKKNPSTGLEMLKTFFAPGSQLRSDTNAYPNEEDITEWVSSLTDEEREVLADYARWDSSETNRYFHHKIFRNAIDNFVDAAYPLNYKDKAATPEELLSLFKTHRDRLLRRIEVLDKVGERNVFEKPVVLYSGMRFSSENMVNPDDDPNDFVSDNFKVGSTYQHTSYMSSSTNPAVGAFFSNTGSLSVVFEVLTKQGTPLKPFAHIGWEDEVLLSRNNEYTVVNVVKNVPYESAANTSRDSFQVERTTRTVVQLVDNSLLKTV